MAPHRSRAFLGPVEDLPERLRRLRLWNDQPLPPALFARLERYATDYAYYTERIRDLEAERRRQMREETGDPAIAKAAQLFRNYDLTEAQFNVLFSLKYAVEDITQAELGKRLVVTRASITSVLDKLESKDLVRRVNVPDNRRIHHVELTIKGRALIDQVEPRYRDEIHLALSDMEIDDCHQLIRQLEKARGRVQNL